MFLTMFGIALTVFACRDVTAPNGTRLPISSSHLLNPSGTVVVSPENMHGWTFYDDQRDSICTDAFVCRLVVGPAGPPLGVGSAELATPTAGDGKALVLHDYAGTRLDSITELRYATYRQSADAGNNLAIALQITIDYDLTDQAAGYQGRLVFEPYQGLGGNVPQNSWQSWDAKAGRWWGTKASVPKNGVVAANPCVQATPCTWSQLLAAFPNIGVHATYGAVILKAGSNWAGFRGNVDKLAIGVNGETTTFDFEPYAAPRVSLVPPDTTPFALFDSLGTVSGAPLSGGPFRRDIILVEFRFGTPLAQRQAAIDSVGGIVVGGKRYQEAPHEGTYYVQIRGGTSEALLSAVETLHRQPQVALATWWEMGLPHEQAYRRPHDGVGWQKWLIDPTTWDATRPTWALEYVRAPQAWGCSTGSFNTAVAVVDEYVNFTKKNTFGNLDFGASNVLAPFDQDVDYGALSIADHGARVASVLASVGNDGQGMTGMAWQARLILRDRFSLIDQPGTRVDGTNQEETTRLFEDHVVAAGRAGADVINLSLGVDWPNGQDAMDRQRLQRADRARRAVDQAIARLDALTMHPLFVIAAGNYHVPAKLSGYAAAKEDYPDQVLVVGGLDTDGSVWGQSNTGPLIDVHAPAVHVSQANGNDRIVSAEAGTSFAAPLVSGTAVLLKDFDPSLTATQLIDMITAGARRENGIKKLDAYGALRAAAERAGAPLCGNRIWNDGTNKIVVERGNSTETIITDRDPSDYAAYVNPYHGGKRIDLGFSYQYNWDAATRTFKNVSYTNAPLSEVSGAWLSYTYVADHDNVMWARRIDTSDATGQVSRLRLLRTSDDAVLIDLGSLHLPGTARRPGSVCVMEYPVDTSGHFDAFIPKVQFSGQYQCVQYRPMGAWDSAPVTVPLAGEPSETPILGSVAPQSDAVFVPVNIRHLDFQWSGTFVGGCNSHDTDSTYKLYVVRQCAYKTVDIDSAVSAMVYRVDTATKQWTLIPLLPDGSTTRTNREINSLEVSEDGKEIMISTTQRVGHSEWDLARSCHDETLEWVSIDRSATPTYPPGTVIKRVPVPQGTSCGGWVEAGGTTSPSRIPTGLTPLMAAPSAGRNRRP